MNVIKLLSPAAGRGTSSGITTTLYRAVQRPAQARTATSGSWTPVRHKSGPYGYTQAKSLVYSKYGEPKDVLK